MNKTTIDYRFLTAEEISPTLLARFQRRQEVTHCWRKEDGLWVIRPAERTIGDWGEKEQDFICWCLSNTLASGGMVAGAFVDGKLKGILSVEPALFGSRKQYLEIPFLQVSREMRGRGIGRELFAMAKTFAADKGAEKLYISSNPAVETQAFYRAMGCVEAEEYSEAHVRQGPLDCQMECNV